MFCNGMTQWKSLAHVLTPAEKCAADKSRAHLSDAQHLAVAFPRMRIVDRYARFGAPSPRAPGRLRARVEERAALAYAHSMLRLRPPSPHELAALTDLCLRSKAVWGYDEAFMRACRAELTLTQRDLETSRLQVAERDGAVVGV